MEGMFNPLSILLHILNAAILLTALYFLLYKPVRKYMNARAEGVAQELKRVEDAKSDLEIVHKQAQDELAAARKQAAETVAASVSQAQEQAQHVLEEARQNADDLMNQTRTEADALMKNARDEMRGEVANLSVNIAGRLLQREVKKEDHEKLIDDFLKKVG